MSARCHLNDISCQLLPNGDLPVVGLLRLAGASSVSTHIYTDTGAKCHPDCNLSQGHKGSQGNKNNFNTECSTPTPKVWESTRLTKNEFFGWKAVHDCATIWSTLSAPMNMRVPLSGTADAILLPIRDAAPSSIYWVRIEAQANLCQLVCILFGKCIPTMQLAGETIQDGSTSMLPCCMDPKPDHFHWCCGRTYSPVNYHNCGTSPLKSWAHHFLFVAITIFNRQITYNL